MITRLIMLSFTAYSLTFLLTSSSLLGQFRRYVIRKLPQLQPTGHKHFIECRMCVGFWMSLFICSATHDLRLTFVVYGMSYFLATQER